MIKTSSSLLETLLIIWFIVVYFSYIYFHQGFLVFIPILITGLLVLFFWKYVIKKIKKNLFNLRINRPLWQYSLFLLTTTLILALLIRLIGNLSTDKLPFLPFLNTEVFVINNILIKTLFLSILTILSASIGKKIFKIFKFKIDDLKEEFIFSFGLGFLAINYLSFFITALGWLYFWPSLIMVLILAFLSWNEIRYFIGLFLKTNFKFNISTDFYDKDNLRSWIWILIFIFLLTSFIITFKTFSLEADDLIAYITVPKLYAQYHQLIPFYNLPAAIEAGIGMNFYALINILLSPDFVFHLSWLFLVFVIFTLHTFTVKFFSKNISIITLLLAISTPWNFFFINTQKVEFIFTFISMIAVFAFFNWLNEEKDKQLYLSAILLGYATSTKLNGLILVLTLFILLLCFLIIKKINFKKNIIFAFIIFLFFLPSMVLNTYYYKNPIIQTLNIPKQEKIFNDHKKVTMYDLCQKTNICKQKNKEKTIYVRQNHPTNSKIINFFWLLWNTTINQKGFYPGYVDIGPYLLIFVPFFLFYIIAEQKTSFFLNYKKNNLLILLAISLTFFTVWYFVGAERPRYGIAIFYFSLIFCAIVLQNIQNIKYNFFIYTLVVIFVIQNTISSIATIPILPNTIFYTPNTANNKYQQIPMIKMFNFINKEILDKNNNPLILWLQGASVAHIQNADKTIIADKNLAYWSKLLQETNSLENAKNTLKKQGVTHILFPVTLKTITENPISDQEINIINQFQKEQLTKIHCEETHCLYKID